MAHLSPTDSESGRCSMCQKPTSRQCGGCSGAPAYDSPAPRTFYCGPSCQRSDWSRHKEGCKILQARKLLLRAATFAEAIMVRIRKNAYPLSIASVEHKTETLVDLATEDGNVSRESNLKPMATNLEAFQGHPELLKSVCLHAAGAESMLYLYNIVKEMVAGTCSMISEVAVFPNTQRLRINSPLKTTSHHVYKVATKHGELWAMDVTGAQHGHSNSLLPWSVYKTERCLKVDIGSELGTLRNRPEYSLGAFPTQKPIDKGHIQLIAHELDLRIHELAAENGGHLEALLKGPLAPFQSATTRFLDQLEARVRAIVGNPSLPTEFSTMTFGSPEKPYCIRSTPGKGMGMFATRRIPRGTRILSESPVFKLPRFSASLAAVKAGINQSVRRLNDAQRESFYALHNAHGNSESPALGITMTNALPFGADATEGGIFLEASRINHSCKQNAQNTWNGNLDQTTIHALKDIEEGEEITISYMGESGDYATRQAHLTASFHFSCICECCSLPEAERAASDERLDRMSRIDSLLGDGYGIVGSPLTHLGHAREMKGLMEQEGILDARVARLYYDAFQVAVANGDQARAKVFAERAHAERLVIEGEDGPETARVKQYVERPASHRLFGTTMKWKQHVAEIPQGLGEKEFEKWLWKS